MDEHPKHQILKDFLLGRLSSGDRKQVVAHLITGCPQCREEMAPTAAMLFRPHRNTSVSFPQDEELYDRAIESAYRKTLERQRSLERERAGADAKIEKLLSDPKAGKRGDFWTWGLCERLLKRSWALRQEKPSEMLRLARFAVEAAERLSPDRYGAQNVADLLARAWAALANAYRISDQFSFAETAFRQAYAARLRGTRSPLLQARLSELSASLLCDQRHFPHAFRLLDFAYRIYRTHDRPHEAGNALIQKGIHTGRSGDPEYAIRLLVQGIRLLERRRNPKLVFHALHNVLLFRVELEEFKTAQFQLWEMRPLYNFYADKINLLKLRGLEGRIYAGLGDFDRATRAFLYVKESFEEERMDYDAALISFDLAAVWLRQGKRAEVQQLLHEMLERFRVRYIAREGVAALIMLRKAADRNELTTYHLESVSRLFQSLKDDSRDSNVRS